MNFLKQKYATNIIKHEISIKIPFKLSILDVFDSSSFECNMNLKAEYDKIEQFAYTAISNEIQRTNK